MAAIFPATPLDVDVYGEEGIAVKVYLVVAGIAGVGSRRTLRALATFLFFVSPPVAYFSLFLSVFRRYPRARSVT